ncbi:carbohydrate-binding family 9-like protein, partial [Bacteroidota bacterium]
MSTLKIIKLEFEEEAPLLESISRELDKIGEGNKIALINWESFSYKPEVRFNIAYTNKELLLKYYVKEKYIKAEKGQTNQMVSEDSCVEFFITPPGSDEYFNFEFNCIGTCLLGKGHSRSDSGVLEPDLINKIRRKSNLGDKTFSERTGDFSWELTVAIPFEIFINNSISELKNKKFKANFYKCGDNLKEAHYL